ncbi:MAG: RHS repeat domain-containing protein [Candidatus Kapaibacterium sp.]
MYIHNPAICHLCCLSHEHSSYYDVGLDNCIDNADDIDHQPNGFVYQYEKNGNLRRDNQEHIQLEWTMAGKVKKVINTVTENTKAEFLYDAMGNRVRKTVYTSEGNVERNIFYTYAPDGKLLQMTEQSNEGLLMSMEYPLYGISRLGLYKVTSSLSRDDESANLYIFPRYFDRRMYELTDHLGNVRAVVGDRKLWNSSFAGEFRANVLSVSNYYPFGMAQTGRNWDGNGNYRYGYNGKEEDNEIKTNSGDNGKSLDYGARWYDPRKARWDAVDKYEAKYVGISPYVFVLNTPIQAKDPDGNVVLFINGMHNGDGGQSKYWGGYDYKFMETIGDFSARYIDGALGGLSNVIKEFDQGLENPNFWSVLTHRSHFLAGLKEGIRRVENYSSVNLKIREQAGYMQGIKDADNILDNLEEGESIKIVTHSMGTAFSRGYIVALEEAIIRRKSDAKIELLLDINSFQGAMLTTPRGILSLNKTGGEDGKNFLSSIYHAVTKDDFSVPGVGKVNNSKDITSKAEKSKGHNIANMSVENIPFIGNNGHHTHKPIEQGSDNVNAKQP